MENSFTTSSSSSSSSEHERQLCFVNEPKALSAKEMKLAREAALQVINNYSKEEALRLFLEGSEPVMISVKPILDDLLTSDSDSESEDDEEY